MGERDGPGISISRRLQGGFSVDLMVQTLGGRFLDSQGTLGQESGEGLMLRWGRPALYAQWTE